MAKIPYQISPIPSLLIDIIHVLYNTLAPGVELDRVVDDTDHSSPQSVLFANLDPGTYIIKVHSSADGDTLGNLLHDFWVDAIADDDSTLEFLFYQVDGPEDHDPVTGVDKIIDPYFAGKNIIGLFREGSRPIKKDVEWLVNGDNEIELLANYVDGNPIINFPNAVWVVTILHTQTAGSSGAQIFGNVAVITADTVFDSTLYDTDIFARAAGNKLTLTMPPVAAFAEKKGFVLIHDRGNAINVILAMQPGETCRFRGQDVARVVLGINNSVKAIRKTIGGISYLFVEPIYGEWDRLGEVIEGRMLKDNTILLEPATEYDLSIYVRLSDYKDTLPGDQIVGYGNGVGQYDYQVVIGLQTYYPNRGFFAYDPIGNKLKVPDMRGMSMRFLSNIGGADADRAPNIPGGYMGWIVGEHKHIGMKAENTSHGSSSSNQPGPNVKLLVNTSSGVDATISHAEITAVNVGKENTVRNYGFLPLMII